MNIVREAEEPMLGMGICHRAFPARLKTRFWEEPQRSHTQINVSVRQTFDIPKSGVNCGE
jgi:hypothetical protein